MEIKIQLPKELQTEVASKLLGNALVGILRQDILNRYKQTGEITDEDWEFCEQIDWHPVDELPPKPEHLEEVRKILDKGKFIKFNSVSEIFEEK